MASMSLLAFIGHLAAVARHVHEHEQRALEHVGKIVEAEAKHELGTYQAAAGPFAGWAELADRTKDDRVQQGYSENDPGVRVGDMRESVHHAVGNKEVVIGSDDEKAVWFELGTVHQPPRSFLGAAVVHKEHDIKAILGGSVVSSLVGRDVFHGQIPIIK